jgi:hypothetical protein
MLQDQPSKRNVRGDIFVMPSKAVGHNVRPSTDAVKLKLKGRQTQEPALVGYQYGAKAPCVEGSYDISHDHKLQSDTLSHE